LQSFRFPINRGIRCAGPLTHFHVGADAVGCHFKRSIVAKEVSNMFQVRTGKRRLVLVV
jgi:hypothetical protein